MATQQADPFPNSIAFRPLSGPELDVLRARGRCDDRFDALVRRVVRLQVAAGLWRMNLDPEARLGLERAEDDALARLARHPAFNRREFDLKRSVLGPAADRGGNIARMVTAALAGDAARLGVDLHWDGGSWGGGAAR